MVNCHGWLPGGISIRLRNLRSVLLPRFFPLDFTGNAQIVKCCVTSLSAELSDPNMNIWKFPQYATREKHTYICNKSSFEYASTSTMKPRQHQHPTFPRKRWLWRPGARPIGWCGAWPNKIHGWCLKDDCEMGSFRKVKNKSHSSV